MVVCLCMNGLNQLSYITLTILTARTASERESQGLGQGEASGQLGA